MSQGETNKLAESIAALRAERESLASDLASMKLDEAEAELERAATAAEKARERERVEVPKIVNASRSARADLDAAKHRLRPLLRKGEQVRLRLRQIDAALGEAGETPETPESGGDGGGSFASALLDEAIKAGAVEVLGNGDHVLVGAEGAREKIARGREAAAEAVGNDTELAERIMERVDGLEESGRAAQP